MNIRADMKPIFSDKILAQDLFLCFISGKAEGRQMGAGRHDQGQGSSQSNHGYGQ